MKHGIRKKVEREKKLNFQREVTFLLKQTKELQKYSHDSELINKKLVKLLVCSKLNIFPRQPVQPDGLFPLRIAANFTGKNRKTQTKNRKNRESKKTTTKIEKYATLI